MTATEDLLSRRAGPKRAADGIDRARAREYALLATLLSRGPKSPLICRLALLRGDATPLGTAHATLGEAAGRSDESSTRREYFDLFLGLGQGVLLPYASYYLTGSLYGRPLARLRETFQVLHIERTMDSEPEDHIAVLCEIMAGLISGDIGCPIGSDREFFETHLSKWAVRFFADLERVELADFYRRVGSVGRIFMEIEAEARLFDLPGLEEC